MLYFKVITNYGCSTCQSNKKAWSFNYVTDSGRLYKKTLIFVPVKNNSGRFMHDSYGNLKIKIDNLILQQKNCCKAGCSFCCYQMIEVFDLEYEDIIKYVSEKMDDDTKRTVKGNLIEWFKFFNKNTPENILDFDIYNHLIRVSLTKKAKCPLLIKDKCSIYEVRPLACRVHIVERDPQLCKSDPYRDSAKISSIIRNDLLGYFYTRLNTYILPLPYIMAKELLPGIKLKPISKTYIRDQSQ